MAWKQLRIDSTREQVASIEATLETLDALSVTLQDNADEPILEPGLGETPLWQQTALTALFNEDCHQEDISSKLLEKHTLPSTALQWTHIEDKDWEREWMDAYEPIQCADNFWICPSWKIPPDPKAINLILDPGLAFGTGTHPTTYLCLQWLAQAELKGKTLIDYGCGSGILGIAALLLGAERAIGVDIDPQALQATQDNLLRNGLGADKFPVYLPEQLPPMKVDIVAANILAGPLVELQPQLCSLLKTRGQICLSGILSEQRTALIAAYENNFVVDSAAEKDGWLCVAARKKAS